MKKIKSLLFLLAILMLSGCKQEESSEANVYPVYYVSNSETKVEVHEYEMQSDELDEQLLELMECLATVPGKLEYKAPLSMGFQVLSVNREENTVRLNVDGAYLKLPATTEVLVRAAIVRTLTQIPDVRYVGITVEGETLYDSIGQPVGLMGAEEFIDNDGNEINTYELTKVKLYFADESGEKLIATYREKYYSSNIPIERFVVDELITGPSGQVEGIYPSVNSSTKLVNIMTKDGICYVNLDENFLTAVNNVSMELAIYSVVNSLVELSNVNKVQILINGEIPSTFSNTVFERNLDYVITLDK